MPAAPDCCQAPLRRERGLAVSAVRGFAQAATMKGELNDVPDSELIDLGALGEDFVREPYSPYARLGERGRLVYAGAGTSGRLAVQDGAELMPTFNWPPERLVMLIAGGQQALLHAVEGAEDEAAKAAELIARHGVGAGDGLIAVAASGTTPFTLACLREARRHGALTIGIANNPGTPLLADRLAS